jgi:cysteine desulfurase
MASIYLDNNATSPVAPEVVSAMLPFLESHFGNPSSLHRIGARASTALREAREKAAAFLHCRESELVFTSGGTEGNNAAIRGVLEAAPEKRHIVTTRVEHLSVLEVCKYLEGSGYRVTYVGVDREGRLDLNELDRAITNETAIVSIMYANNETGVIFPIDEIADIIKPHGVPLHVDAVQAAGKIPIDLSKTLVDLLTLSGHKIHGPKGTGLLYIRRGTRTRPLIIGGGQEKGRRSGTEDIPSIVGFGVALELAGAHMGNTIADIRRLRNNFEEKVLSGVPNALRIGAAEPRVATTSNICFEGVEGEAILLLLDEAGICASSGSACSTGAIEPSHVLKAMNVPSLLAQGSIRFSLSRYTTAEDIDTVVEELPPIIHRLRRLSETTDNAKRNAL